MQEKSISCIISGSADVGRISNPPHHCTCQEAQWLSRILYQRSLQKHVLNVKKHSLRQQNFLLSAEMDSIITASLAFMRSRNIGAKMTLNETVCFKDKNVKERLNDWACPFPKLFSMRKNGMMRCMNVQSATDYCQQLPNFSIHGLYRLACDVHVKIVVARQPGKKDKENGSLMFRSCVMTDYANVVPAMRFCQRQQIIIVHAHFQHVDFSGNVGNARKQEEDRHHHCSMRSITKDDVLVSKLSPKHLLKKIGVLPWNIGSIAARSVANNKGSGGISRQIIGYPSLIQNHQEPWQPISSHYVGA